MSYIENYVYVSEVVLLEGRDMRARNPGNEREMNGDGKKAPNFTFIQTEMR